MARRRSLRGRARDSHGRLLPKSRGRSHRRRSYDPAPRRRRFTRARRTASRARGFGRRVFAMRGFGWLLKGLTGVLGFVVGLAVVEGFWAGKVFNDGQVTWLVRGFYKRQVMIMPADYAGLPITPIAPKDLANMAPITGAPVTGADFKYILPFNLDKLGKAEHIASIGTGLAVAFLGHKTPFIGSKAKRYTPLFGMSMVIGSLVKAVWFNPDGDNASGASPAMSTLGSSLPSGSSVGAIQQSQAQFSPAVTQRLT